MGIKAYKKDGAFTIPDELGRFLKGKGIGFFIPMENPPALSMTDAARAHLYSQNLAKFISYVESI